MFYVFGNNIQSHDRSTMVMILGHANIQQKDIRFVDLDHEEPDVNKFSVALCTGSSLKIVARALSKAGKYRPQDLIGQDVVDEANAFALYNIGMNINEIVLNDENKAYVWSKVSSISEYYQKWFPFNDELPDMSTGSKEEPSTDTEAKEAKEVKEITETVTDNPAFDYQATETKASDNNTQNVQVVENTEGQDLGEISIEVKEVMAQLFEQVKLTDPSLGKSLAQYDVLTFKNGNAELRVYPTNRIPEKDPGLKISLKDLVSIIRAAEVLDSGIISFRKKEGDVVT